MSVTAFEHPARPKRFATPGGTEVTISSEKLKSSAKGRWPCRSKLRAWQAGTTAIVVATVTVMSSAQSQGTAWEPQRAIEFVVPTGPGGANDTAARMLQGILQIKNLTKLPVNVVNKPGGGGAITYTYMNQHPGDGHYISVIPINLITNHILGRSSFNYTDFTPIAQLYSEYITFTVKADSQIKDGKDLVARLRQDPQSVSFAFASAAGNQSHIAIGMVAKAAGVPLRQIKTVIFNAGGQATTALLGGHVDVQASASGTILSHQRSGKVRVIAVASPQRLTGPLVSVPTWKGMGFNAVFSSWRSMIGPKEMPANQIAYWDVVIRNVVAADEWKKALDDNLWVDQYMNAQQSKAFLAQQYTEIKTILTELGLASR